jgi:hypothetical protein
MEDIKRKLNKHVLALGSVFTAVGLFGGTKALMMPVTDKVIWGGFPTPAHAAGWNILAITSMFAGFTLIEFVRPDGVAYRSIFYSTIFCGLALLGVAIAHM